MSLAPPHARSAEAGVDASARLSRARYDGEGLLWTSEISQLLPIKMGDTQESSRAPTTLMRHFRDTVTSCGRNPALRQRKEGVWVTHSWRFYDVQVRRFARSLLALGLQPFDVVCTLGFNAPEWHISAMGAVAAGGVTCGLYETATAASCAYITAHAEAKVIVVDCEAQLNKLLEVRATLPHLRALVVFGGGGATVAADCGGMEGVYTWKAFMALGAAGSPAAATGVGGALAGGSGSGSGHMTHTPEAGNDALDAALEARIAAQRPEHCCALVYTSGTTGVPKGAMISHDNITWTARAILQLFAATPRDRMVSYLPLSHVAAAMLDIWGAAIAGYEVWFAGRDALKGTLVDTLKECKPTIFFGVPRVYEKIQERMADFGRRRNCCIRAIAAWAKRKGTLASAALEEGRPMPLAFWVADRLVFRNVRAALGLQRCRAQFSGAAPMAPATLQYFSSLFLPVNELYGMTECTGPQSVNYPGDRRTGSSGRAVPGTEMAVHAPSADGVGEVCFRGRNVFMGYLRDPARTAEAVDGHGYLHSGDVGRIDERGFLVLTGRSKEILVTAGGENVAPLPVENALREELPCLSNAVAVGDGRKFVSALLTLTCKVDQETGLPTEQLDGAASALALDCGCVEATVAAASASRRVTEAIEAGVQRANARLEARAQTVRRWRLVPQDFSVAGGELTSAMKLRRGEVVKRYAEVVAGMYGDDEAAV